MLAADDEWLLVEAGVLGVEDDEGTVAHLGDLQLLEFFADSVDLIAVETLAEIEVESNIEAAV